MTYSRRRALPLLVILFAASTAAASPPALSRVIGPFPAGMPISATLPSTAFQIEWALERIASSTGVLMGFEEAGAVAASASPPTDITFTGRTVAQALDAIVRADPGYRWSSDGGVVHVRPATAAPADALAQPIRDFRLDAVTPEEALAALCSTLRHGQPTDDVDLGMPETPLAARRFSLPATSGTLIEVLDAVVRRHGAMMWHVTRGGEATVGIGFTVFDSGGIAMPACQWTMPPRQ